MNDSLNLLGAVVAHVILVSSIITFSALPAAGSIPEGYGHLYTMQANAQAWIAVTRPDGWTGAKTERLMDFLVDRDPEG